MLYEHRPQNGFGHTSKYPKLRQEVIIQKDNDQQNLDNFVVHGGGF